VNDIIQIIFGIPTDNICYCLGTRKVDRSQD
jgi:hypothetical protein